MNFSTCTNVCAYHHTRDTEMFCYPQNAFMPFLCNRTLHHPYPLEVTACFFKILSIYSLRERKGRRKKEGETSMCGCLSRAPHWGPGPQPRHVPWLGIQTATLWFTGPCSIHWATPARAYCLYFFTLVILTDLSWYPMGIFLCISHVNNDAKHFFHVFKWHLYLFLVKSLFL